ncbi:MAG: GNAT family N-acetyltransferase [Butyrivibrio sp.]|nr:GNAT family N-acetyltransferase [Butyrivibrio sp.]
MLKTVVFWIDEKNRENEALRAAILDEAEYIRDCGYGAEISFDGKEITDKEMTLVITDKSEIALKLHEEGFFAVGMLHEGNRGTQFPQTKYVFDDIDQVDMDSFVKAYQRYAGEPWEILQTERLIIRETTIEDIDEFYKLYADPEMTLYMEGLFDDPEDEKTYQRDYIEKVYSLMGFGVWTLQRKTDGAIIGRAGYSARNGFEEIELGFLVGKKYQRQGYCMEACNAILDYGRDVLQFDKVQTLVKAENEVSIHICEKLGFNRINEVDVEENIYGNRYNQGKKVEGNQTKYGKYVRMTMSFSTSQQKN